VYEDEDFLSEGTLLAVQEQI
jgi:hypothetical protein